MRRGIGKAARCRTASAEPHHAGPRRASPDLAVPDQTPPHRPHRTAIEAAPSPLRRAAVPEFTGPAESTGPISIAGGR